MTGNANFTTPVPSVAKLKTDTVNLEAKAHTAQVKRQESRREQVTLRQTLSQVGNHV